MPRENIYLGKVVKDTGKKGLDNLGEVRGIAKAILRDYKNHKIDYSIAIRRMNLLELVVTRDSDFQNPIKKKKARAIVDRYRNKLKQMKKK